MSGQCWKQEAGLCRPVVVSSRALLFYFLKRFCNCILLVRAAGEDSPCVPGSRVALEHREIAQEVGDPKQSQRRRHRLVCCRSLYWSRSRKKRSRSNDPEVGDTAGHSHDKQSKSQNKPAARHAETPPQQPTFCLCSCPHILGPANQSQVTS